MHLLPCRFIYDGGYHPLQADAVRIQSAARPLPEQLHPALVPGIDPGIPFICEDGVEAVLSDEAPTLPNSPGHGVQNGVIALPGGVQFKDGPHGPGLDRVHHIGPADDIIAQGRDAAEELPLFGLDRNAVDGLLPGLQDLPLSHTHAQQLHKGVIGVGDVPEDLCRGDHLNARHEHCFSESEPVPHVSRSSGNVVDHDGLELPPPRRLPPPSPGNRYGPCWSRSPLRR